jgi:RNA polymerase sigma-70 factor (ECF subfamily)
MDQANSATMSESFPSLFPGDARYEPGLNYQAGTRLHETSTKALPNLGHPHTLGSTPRISGTTEYLSAADSRFDYAKASDDQLLAAARSFDQQAFFELSGRHIKSIRNRVYGIVRNREDSEDVMQETLFNAYRHLQEFRGCSSFSTWLTRIAVNTSLMVLRKRKSHPELPLDSLEKEDHTVIPLEIPDLSPNAEQMYAREQAIEVMLRALKGLPAPYRHALELFHIQQMSVEQVAKSLGIPLGSAKSRLRRGRLSLRSTLERKRISMSDICYRCRSWRSALL